MTAILDALDDLGTLLAAVVSPNLAYSASPPSLVRNADPWQVAYATGTQIASMETAFNAVTSAIGSGYPASLDTLGSLLASITDNQNGGGHCLAYNSSTHLLDDVTHAYNWRPSGGELASLITAFNALVAAASDGPLTNVGIVVGGQSFMANWNGAASSPTYYTIQHPTKQQQIRRTTGALVSASVPMLDVDGVLDCFLPQMADKIIDDNGSLNVVLSSIAVGGTTFGQFAKGGTYNSRIGEMLGHYESNGIPIKAVIWGQGESDASNGTSTADVTAYVLSIIETFRYHGYAGPIFFSLETISNSPNNVVTYAGNAAVRAGVAAAVALANNAYVGPDVDSVLSSGDRYDNIHPNYGGETKLASAWKTAIAGCLT